MHNAKQKAHIAELQHPGKEKDVNIAKMDSKVRTQNKHHHYHFEKGDGQMEERGGRFENNGK